jgi:hypothetical protein
MQDNWIPMDATVVIMNPNRPDLIRKMQIAGFKVETDEDCPPNMAYVKADIERVFHENIGIGPWTDDWCSTNPDRPDNEEIQACIFSGVQRPASNRNQATFRII